jgi:putative addiction module component (TIGR02574 family)
MNLTATLAEIKTMNIDDRLRLVEAIWDSIIEDQGAPALTDIQKADLSRRVAELDADPNNVLTWEQIKAHVKRQK